MSTGRASVGHPVDVASGAVFTMNDDFAFYSTTPLVWRRYYEAGSDVDGWLGRGWTAPYLMTLARVDGAYRLTDEEGHAVLFPVPEQGLGDGEMVQNLAASMELWRSREFFVVRHWHPGGNPVEHYGFYARAWDEMPLAWWENLAGHRIRVDHDAAGRPVSITQELEQRVIRLEYTASGLIDAAYLVRDDGQLELLVRYEYDALRRLTASEKPSGQRIDYQYDALDRMVRETGPLGASFTFQYDELGRCVLTTGDGGYMERHLRFFATPKRTRVSDGAGNVTEYLLNASGQVLQQISPLGATTTNEYDDVGRLVRTVDPAGGETVFVFDDRGDRVELVAPGGVRTQVRYNDFHLPVELTDPLGGVTTFEYDDRGNLVTLTNALGNTFRYVRDGRGLVVEARTPAGFVLEHRYDERLRWQESRDRFGVVQVVEYDEFGNVVTLGDAEGVHHRFTYDGTRRLSLAETVGEAPLAYAWNALDEMVACTGPGGRHERWEYDRFGQLVGQTNSLDTRLQVEYDQEGRPVAVRNRAGEVMDMTYDADGHLLAERFFDGRTQRYDYDLAGQRTAIVLADGRVVRQRFDVMGNLVARESEDGTLVEQFAYDLGGRLTRASNRDAVAEFECDVIGRLLAETVAGRRVEYAYDADNNRISRSIGGSTATRLRLEVDGRGRLAAVVDANGVFQSFDWDGLDRLIERRSSGGVVESFRYDAGRRVEEQRVTGRAGRPLVQRRYAYDPLANLVGLADGRRGTSELACDPIGRLTARQTDGRPEERYYYDADGALLGTHRGARAVAPGGRTLGDEARRYEYDELGQVALIANGAATLRLEYDLNGQLVRAARSDGLTTTYRYDALGRRLSKQVGGETTEFVWDGSNLAAELRDDQVSEMYLAFNQEVVAHWRGGRRIVPIRDRASTIQEQLSDEGDLLWACTLDAYGNLLDESGADASPFRMRGQYHDRETGLHYNFYRYYSPLLGDYTTPDPVGLAGGTNVYAYPRNPLSWDDPFGLTCSNKHKGKMGESRMDKFYKSKGFTPAHTKGRPRGIDGIYKNTDPNGKPQFIIVEAKYGSSTPKRTVDNNMQLSDGWCNSSISNSGNPKSRVDAALDPSHAAAFNAAAASSDVRKDIYHAPAGQPGYATQHGNYSPTGSSPDLAPGSPAQF